METALDRISNANHLGIMKAAIPYLPFPMQEQCCILLKLMEITNVTSFFRSSDVSSCAFDQDSVSITEMLTQIKEFGNAQEQKNIACLINLFTTIEIYQTMKE